MQSPPPMPPRSPTGFSGEMRATLDPSRVPEAVARLLQERGNNEDWKARHAQRLAVAENEIEEIKDVLQGIALKLATIQQQIAIAETRVNTTVSVVGVVWILLTFAFGVWVALRR